MNRQFVKDLSSWYYRNNQQTIQKFKRIDGFPATTL